jgi:predicted RNA binding protein YcfA (HicA-like mRNA interferase family)
MRNLANISVKEFRAILLLLGLEKVRTKGGHETWMKKGMTRPVIFQNHVDPIPEFIIRNNLRNLGLSKDEFLSLLERK